MVGLISRDAEPVGARRLVPAPKEMGRYPCEDANGGRYCVIVWRVYPSLSTTSYELEDGTPVTYVDDCRFEISLTGVVITRCL